MRQNKMIIEWGRMRQENWMKVNWNESDNYTRWLAVIELSAF